MSDTPESRSIKSGKSGRTSKTSISVTLPHAEKETLLQFEVKSSNEINNTGIATEQTHENNYTNCNNHVNLKRSKQVAAVRKIEKVWMSYRDVQMYKLLKHSICAAEHSLTYELLRKLCPREAEYIKDKLSLCKVRFRFGGHEFPPMIFFKIYLSTSESGMVLKYLSGKKMIQPASEAAQDACELMGHRKFYDQVIQDIIHQDAHKVTDEIDIATLKDYMKYSSLMDETPSYMGGKENSWRKLTLEALPRQTIFYDIVEYLYSKRINPRLKEVIPRLLLEPNNEDTQLEHIHIISQIRELPPGNYTPNTAPLRNKHGTGRRSKHARIRASKMRKLYGLDNKESADGSRLVEDSLLRGLNNPAHLEEWDEEADKLYEWTQDLSFEDLAMTPRMDSSAQLFT